MLCWRGPGIYITLHDGQHHRVQRQNFHSPRHSHIQQIKLVIFTTLIDIGRQRVSAKVILTLTIPLFALAAFTGLVDGLVRRDLRKFGSGRESSYLYHKARGTIIPLTIVPWTVYLAIPISISPLLILLPCAVLLGVSVYITVSSFKKYL